VSTVSANNVPILSIRGLSKSFDGTKALADFSADVFPGGITGLVGPNGAGKTTLFNIIGGFTKPDAGDVRLNGERIIGRLPHYIARQGVARTFQELRLIGRLTAIENILLSFPRQTGESAVGAFVAWPRVTRQERRNRDDATQHLCYVGLGDYADARAADLSYGQQKLLSMACCLAMGGELLLLDEPVAGVAPKMVDRIVNLIIDLCNRGKTILVIEHNFAAVAICNRVIFMDEGRNVVEGTPEEIRTNPTVIERYLA